MIAAGRLFIFFVSFSSEFFPVRTLFKNPSFLRPPLAQPRYALSPLVISPCWARNSIVSFFLSVPFFPHFIFDLSYVTNPLCSIVSFRVRLRAPFHRALIFEPPMKDNFSDFTHLPTLIASFFPCLNVKVAEFPQSINPPPEQLKEEAIPLFAELSFRPYLGTVFPLLGNLLFFGRSCSSKLPCTQNILGKPR